MKKTALFIITICISELAAAKLPPLSEEAQAKAAEAKAKTGWTEKVAAYKTCLAQDRVAAAYFKGKGKGASSSGVAACQDPGPYVVADASVPQTMPASVQKPAAQTSKK